MKASSEVRDLEAKIRAAGFHLLSAGSGHRKIKDAKGALVLAKSGAPVVISASPSDRHWRANAVRQLIDAGVFTEDPYRSGASGKSNNGVRGHHLASPEMQARKIAAIHAKSEVQRRQTADLRSRFEPVVGKLGGWVGHSHSTVGVSVLEVGMVVHHFGTRQGMKFGRKGNASVDNLRGAAQTFKSKDGTLGGDYLPLFTAFIEYLEQDSGVTVDAELASLRYLELLKEAKTPLVKTVIEVELVDEAAAEGDDVVDEAAVAMLPEPEAEPAEQFRRSSPPEAERTDEPESEWPKLRDEVLALIAQAEERLTAPPVKAPVLALEAMALMMRAEIVDEGRVIAVASKIAELELNA